MCFGETTIAVTCPYCRTVHHFFRPVDVSFGFSVARRQWIEWGEFVPHCEVASTRPRTIVVVELGADVTLADVRVATPTDPRSIPVTLRARIFERDNFRCRRCGHSPNDGVKLVIDHIVPVAKGGTRAETNLQTLCESCNLGKGARDPHPHDLLQ